MNCGFLFIFSQRYCSHNQMKQLLHMMFCKLYHPNKSGLSLQRSHTPPHRLESFSFLTLWQNHGFFSNGRMFFNYSPISRLLLGVGVCSGD